MKISLAAGEIVQVVIWTIGLFLQDLSWVETLSFYLAGICLLLAALMSFSALFPDTQTASFTDSRAETASNESRFRWLLHSLCIALPNIVVYLLMAYDWL